MIFIIENEKNWNDLVNGFSPTSFMALIGGKDGGPLEYPCMIRVVETVTINDDNEEVQSFILTFFYREDAFKLLAVGINKEIKLEGYEYAESEAG